MAAANAHTLRFPRMSVFTTPLSPRLPIVRTMKTADGLNLNTRQDDHIVGVNGNTFTYTAERRTLSIVIAYNDQGAGSHITDEYLRTVYVVFPGVPKLEAVLEDNTESDAEVNKPLTVIVAGVGESGGGERESERRRGQRI